MHTTVTITQTEPLNIKVSGVGEGLYKHALHQALGVLSEKLSLKIKQLIVGTQIVIGEGLIQSGGLTHAEDKKIILDAAKNALSLQTAEDYLVEGGYLNKGDWTNALPSSKDQKWSCLTYQLIHEFGHLIDGLSIGKPYKRLDSEFSPTKYGKTSSSESFAEAFAYWIFDLETSPEAKLAVIEIL